MTTTADYSEKIPNNVDLHEDRRLQRALESWQPNFLDWWESMGPTLPTEDVYLRTAINVGREGWAHFGHVAMRDYRWGIFLAERERDRMIGFGQHKGDPAWQKVPGEYRADLQRLIVIQGDTEPASVEQQRNLGATAPSLYDLRNLFQVNVEEGRHLWAMVYLLHAYFGREGREEAEELLHRNSGSDDAPRILGAFNEETPDWLSFFMFTYFTDRDGKYQLGTLKESAFDPLSRTCEFMLKEEAHHMMVGTTGIDRVVQRTVELMLEHDDEEVAARGGIPLAVIQKYLNFHYSVSLDLFGSETSTNVANYYTAGLKGRWLEDRRKDDHKLGDDAINVDALVDGEIGQNEVSALVGLNTDLRREYISDCEGGVKRWNKILDSAGLVAAAVPAARRVQPQGRRVLGHRGVADGGEAVGRRVGPPQGCVAADRRRQDARALAHASGVRARQDRVVDRAAAAGHQRPAVRLRLRASGVTMDWVKEDLPRWDADKQRMFDDVALLSVGMDRPADGASLADEWWHVVGDDGAIAGYGWLDSEWGDAQITFFVDPARRGDGIGEFVLDHLEDEARKRGLNYIYNVVPRHASGSAVDDRLAGSRTGWTSRRTAICAAGWARCADRSRHVVRSARDIRAGLDGAHAAHARRRRLLERARRAEARCRPAVRPRGQAARDRPVRDHVHRLEWAVGAGLSQGPVRRARRRPHDARRSATRPRADRLAGAEYVLRALTHLSVRPCATSDAAMCRGRSSWPPTRAEYSYGSEPNLPTSRGTWE